MTVRPIISSAPMVRALLEGRKRQTRRVLKPQPPEGADLSEAREDAQGYATVSGQRLRIPYAPGDLLWVREAFRGARAYDSIPPKDWGNKPIWYVADGDPEAETWWHLSGRVCPPIHMPRWASRITLRVTDVRVQRVQEISEEDAVAEGIEKSCPDIDPDLWRDYERGGECGYPSLSFATLWNTLHKPPHDYWDGNPWVAAISFDVIRKNVDEVEP